MKYLKAFFILTFALLLSCQTQVKEQNQNSGKANVATSEKDLPPGFSTSPLPLKGSTPGIPDANIAKELPKGPTPTPGIPDPKELSKPFKPGKTPTPGIPSEEEIRRQLNTPVDPNIVNKMPKQEEQKLIDKRVNKKP
jgi:hypothetical protein